MSNFRKNWPLWVAGISAAFSLAAFILFSIVLPKKYSVTVPQFQQTVDYWSIVPMPISDFVERGLLIAWITALIIFLVMLVWVIFERDSRRRKLFVAGLLIVSNTGACLSCATFGFSNGHETILRHLHSIDFHDHKYHLTYVSSGQKWDIHNEYIVVFQCDVSGTVCTLIGDFDYSDLDKTHFRIDTTADSLYVDTGYGNSIVVIPAQE
jgi:hypothetical protein